MNKRLLLFLVLSLGILLVWHYVQVWLNPPPAPKKPVPDAAAEMEALLKDIRRFQGAAQQLARDVDELPLTGFRAMLGEVQRFQAEAAALAAEIRDLPRNQLRAMLGPVLKFQESTDQLARDIRRAARPDKLILGDPSSHLIVEIDPRFATVKSVTLNRFHHLDRLYGRPEKDADGRPKPKRLITDDYHGQFVSDANERQRQSFDLAYVVPPTEGNRPVLGEWDKTSEVQWDADWVQSDNAVAFTGRLGPNGPRVTKTFTLAPDQYHVGLELKFEADAETAFAYQLSGPRGVIPEGMHWAYQPFRHAVYGVVSSADSRDFKRWLVDPKPLQAGKVSLPSLQSGSDPQQLQYAGVMMPHFSSLIIVDGPAANLRYINEVAADYLGEDALPASWERWQPYSGLVSVRLATGTITVGKEPVVHKYLLYAGPTKASLLRYSENVAPELVSRYVDELRLDRLTDSPSDWWLPRFFWNIGWTKLIIWFTNLMHVLLEWLHAVFGHYGIAIVAMTVLVRALLFPISRKQAQISQRMQEKMAAIAPERQKIREKFKDNMAERQRAEMELFRKHGINPLGGCTGCLILLLQMPVFMGLYYALNESVHLRQAGFLWIDNLAAPDMLFQWGDWPVFHWLATGFFRLGDYFHLLPIISIVLMVMMQKLMTPAAMTEEQAMQMKMMNFMMIFIGYMFFWVYSGLCLYFIVSSAWGILERKLLPKKAADAKAAAAAEIPKPAGKPPKPSAAKPAGWRQRLSAWWQNLLEEAKKKNR